MAAKFSNSNLAKLATIAMAALSLAIPAHISDAQETETSISDVEMGYALAQTNCARCHQIEIDGESPHLGAPPFWQMSELFPVATIDEALILGLSPQHSDMPIFDVTPKEAKQLTAWIDWIQPVSYGKRVVESYCSNCHAIGADDPSFHKEAPPFRNLSERFPIRSLEQKFADGIVSDHPDMPNFIVDAVTVRNVIAYIESVQEKK